MAWRMHKYPRTRHVETNRPGAGDPPDAVRFAELAGAHLVVEEKLDGANSAISFDAEGRLRLQARGHELTGSPRERHFALLKAWAGAHRDALWGALGDRYVCYGEWCFAKHTMFYDRLEHYFFEFDVLDTSTGAFLDTPARRELLAGLRWVAVPVLHQGTLAGLDELVGFVAPSLHQSPSARDALEHAATAAGVSPEAAVAESYLTGLSEGLYLKWEDGGQVRGRCKWVWSDFGQRMVVAGDHWQQRPLIPNGLAAGVDLWAVS